MEGLLIRFIPVKTLRGSWLTARRHSHQPMMMMMMMMADDSRFLVLKSSTGPFAVCKNLARLCPVLSVACLGFLNQPTERMWPAPERALCQGSNDFVPGDDVFCLVSCSDVAHFNGLP